MKEDPDIGKIDPNQRKQGLDPDQEDPIHQKEGLGKEDPNLGNLNPRKQGLGPDQGEDPIHQKKSLATEGSNVGKAYLDMVKEDPDL